MTTAKWLVFTLFILVAAIALAIVLTPSLREGIQTRLQSKGREVLATAEGDLLQDGTLTKVIKYRNAEGIWVEILKVNPNGGSLLIDRILLPDKLDGLFNFQGHVTRLAIADIDENGTLELLAPTFDPQLVPHLNVFRYNTELKKFEPYNPPAQ